MKMKWKSDHIHCQYNIFPHMHKMRARIKSYIWNVISNWWLKLPLYTLRGFIADFINDLELLDTDLYLYLWNSTVPIEWMKKKAKKMENERFFRFAFRYCTNSGKLLNKIISVFIISAETGFKTQMEPWNQSFHQYTIWFFQWHTF